MLRLTQSSGGSRLATTVPRNSSVAVMRPLWPSPRMKMLKPGSETGRLEFERLAGPMVRRQREGLAVRVRRHTESRMAHVGRGEFLEGHGVGVPMLRCARP